MVKSSILWSALALCVAALGCGSDSPSSGQNAGSGGGSAGQGSAAGKSGSTASAGSAGKAGSADPPDASAAGGENDLTGKLGALGAVQPIVNGWATTNGNETLIYLSSAPLTCKQMMTEGTPWLRSLPAGSQVIEIVVRGRAKVGT